MFVSMCTMICYVLLASTSIHQVVVFIKTRKDKRTDKFSCKSDHKFLAKIVNAAFSSTTKFSNIIAKIARIKFQTTIIIM